MLLHCKTNVIPTMKTMTFQPNQNDLFFIKGHNDVPITPEEFYNAYAVLHENGDTWYYIADDNYSVTRYPMAYPSYFFDVFDGRESVSWKSEIFKSANGSTVRFVTFEEWLNDKTFYEKLVDGYEKERNIFVVNKAFVDYEFPNPRYPTTECVFENYYYCSKCDNVWDENLINRSIICCPNCGMKYNAKKS